MTQHEFSNSRGESGGTGMPPGQINAPPGQRDATARSQPHERQQPPPPPQEKQQRPARSASPQVQQRGRAAAGAAAEGQRAADEVREKGSELADRAKAEADATAEQTRRKVSEFAGQARARGQDALETQKHRAADQLHTVGSAVHRAAGKLREERDENLAGYADALADEIDRMADYLDAKPLGALGRDAQALARRRPELFLGGMFVAGLALTRFLKSSSHSERRWNEGGGGAVDSLSATSNRSGTTRGLAGGGVSPASVPAREDDIIIVDEGASVMGTTDRGTSTPGGAS